MFTSLALAATLASGSPAITTPAKFCDMFTDIAPTMALTEEAVQDVAPRSYRGIEGHLVITANPSTGYYTIFWTNLHNATREQAVVCVLEFGIAGEPA